MKNKLNLWKIFIVILIVIVLIYVMVINFSKKNNNNSNNKNQTSTQTSEKYRMIRIDEDLLVEGTVEGIEDLRWDNARITQYDNKIEVYIMLTSISEVEKIPARKLDVKLIDKSGKVIATKEAEMQEIAEMFGYTTLELVFDTSEKEVVYDIQIVAK